MTRDRKPVCIRCEQAAVPGVINRLPDGRICPICRDRLLDSIPPALPRQAPEPGRRELELAEIDLPVLRGDDPSPDDPIRA
jgi:hypothetical protein